MLWAKNKPIDYPDKNIKNSMNLLTKELYNRVFSNIKVENSRILNAENKKFSFKKIEENKNLLEKNPIKSKEINYFNGTLNL